MRSFDFYDTLVTRLVGKPSDIFSIVGERLGIADFEPMRIKAELDARAAEGPEVTFSQIYDHLPLPSDVKERAQVLELQFEESLVAPIAAVCCHLKTGDLIVSDMYHDEHLYRRILGRLVPDARPRDVLVSGTIKVNKSGGGLWKVVASDYPEHVSHIGDNMHSDVNQARRNGLVAEHFAHADFNAYEKKLAEHGLDGSLLAGASRATRLSLTRLDTSPQDAAAIQAFASVFAPLLYAYVSWILSTCAKKDIRDVFFLARDGQLPFQIASRMAAATGQNIRCYYVYASRQSLHLPACLTIDDAESWLLENTPHLSLRTIAERASVAAEVLQKAAGLHLDVSFDQNLPQQQRKLLTAVIREPVFVDAFMQNVSSTFQAASAYYLDRGLGQPRIALVDVGWNGRLQRSLGNLLLKCEARPQQLLGLYLCLSKRMSDAPGDELIGFLADPERPEEVAFFDRYRHVFEAALSADHPTTTGFQLKAGISKPIFGDPYPAEVARKIALQHEVVNTFTDMATALSAAADRPLLSPQTCITENLKQYLSRPTHADGLAFTGFDFVDGQAGNETEPISRIVRFSELFKQPRKLGYWTEGTLSASGLAWINELRRALRKLRNLRQTR